MGSRILQPFKINSSIKGLEGALARMKKGEKDTIDRLEKGMLKAGMHLAARGKALAPLAPPDQQGGNLQASINSSGKVEKTADGMHISVGANAFKDDENYGLKTHENMDYKGPPCGGSRTQGQGPRTKAKGVSPIEPTDGEAGGKYLERAIRNKPEQYTQIIRDEVAEVLGD